MMVTQKSQYALRALFEPARRADAGPTRIEDVAKAQGIPQRFLEVVLNELKRSGLVEARRGPRGGYQCAFLSLWEEVRAAVGRVYGSTTLQSLIDREEERLAACAYDFSI